jgi:hypothetical protein
MPVISATLDMMVEGSWPKDAQGKSAIPFWFSSEKQMKSKKGHGCSSSGRVLGLIPNNAKINK